jgi:hypothetical protein
MFRVQFPEANGVSDTLVTQYLGAAALEIDLSVWGAFSDPVLAPAMTKADQGQLYLAAHKLAISPFGQNAKMTTVIRKNESGYRRTTYGAEFLLLMQGVTGGFRVA